MRRILAALGRFACFMDWHRPGGSVGFDGCSMNSYCARCGRRILLDSQGSWFSVGIQQAEEKKGS